MTRQQAVTLSEVWGEALGSKTLLRLASKGAVITKATFRRTLLITLAHLIGGLEVEFEGRQLGVMQDLRTLTDYVYEYPVTG